MQGPANDTKSRYNISSAAKTLEVLFAFERTPAPASLQDLADRAHLTPNQTYRCLKTLQDFGLVRDLRTGYALTTALLRLAPHVPADPTLLEVAGPPLVGLRQRTGETVNLMALVGEGEETVCIATFPSAHSVRLVTQVGQRAPLHAGATSKAILAFLSPEAQASWLARLDQLPRFTDRTTMDPASLARELAEIRERGYSISDADYEAGARGVGAPIFGADGRPVGGLSVGGPNGRVTDAQIRLFGALAVEVAAAISHRLGHGVGSGPASLSAAGDR